MRRRLPCCIAKGYLSVSLFLHSSRLFIGIPITPGKPVLLPFSFSAHIESERDKKPAGPAAPYGRFDVIAGHTWARPSACVHTLTPARSRRYLQTDALIPVLAFIRAFNNSAREIGLLQEMKSWIRSLFFNDLENWCSNPAEMFGSWFSKFWSKRYRGILYPR